jgi:hypothetical protein
MRLFLERCAMAQPGSQIMESSSSEFPTARRIGETVAIIRAIATEKSKRTESG